MPAEIKLLQIYRCDLCGNVVEVVRAGKPALVCCGQPMVLLVENTTDAALEKHVPVVQSEGERLVASVGSDPHPMEPEHYIEWIELVADGDACRRFLSPGDAPRAEFPGVGSGDVVARAYCNLHGLWKA